MGDALSKLGWVKSVMPVDTNIVIFEVADGLTPERCLAKFSAHQIRALAFSATEIRLVTHLDFSDTMLERVVAECKKFSF